MRDSNLQKIVFEGYRNSSLIVVFARRLGLAGRDLVATNLVANANNTLQQQVGPGGCGEQLRSLELVIGNYDFEMALDHLRDLESLIAEHLAC